MGFLLQVYAFAFLVPSVGVGSSRVEEGAGGTSSCKAGKKCGIYQILGGAERNEVAVAMATRESEARFTSIFVSGVASHGTDFPVPIY